MTLVSHQGQSKTSRPPLSGVRVLDFSRVLAGPFGTMLLADLGCDVIKVEHPDGGDDTRRFGPPFVGDGVSTYFVSINRGKRSVALDLKSEQGRSTVRGLICASDVLVENFRPGVADRLGFGWEAAHEMNERLVYASISGYGHAGLPKFARAPGYDLMMQSLSGVTSLTGPPDAPPSKAGVSIGDLVAGLYAVHGILAALYDRERTGKGRRVDIGMLDGLVSLLTYQASAYLLAGKVPTRMGNQHPSICPFETLPTADSFIAVCCGNDLLFGRLCEAIGREELPTEDRFATNASRVQHRPALIGILEQIFVQQPTDHWLERLSRPGKDVPCAPMLSVDEALDHPQLKARGMLTSVQDPDLGELPTVGCPVRLDSEPCFNDRPAPRLGEHTHEVLAELGLLVPDGG